MPVQSVELAELLSLLLDSSVEFVLVGGGASLNNLHLHHFWLNAMDSMGS